MAHRLNGKGRCLAWAVCLENKKLDEWTNVRLRETLEATRPQTPAVDCRPHTIKDQHTVRPQNKEQMFGWIRSRPKVDMVHAGHI
jgi:hypothetical protein